MYLLFLFDHTKRRPRPGDETDVARALGRVFEEQGIVDEEIDALFERCKSLARKAEKGKHPPAQHWMGGVSAFYNALLGLKPLPLLAGWKFEIPENGPSGRVLIINTNLPRTDDFQQA
jgi:hypothetical protein